MATHRQCAHALCARAVASLSLSLSPTLSFSLSLSLTLPPSLLSLSPTDLRAAFGPNASAWSASFPVGYLRSKAAACRGAADGAVSRPPVLLTNAAPGRDWGLHEHTDLLEPLLRASGFSVSRLELADCGHVSSLAGVGVAGAEGEEVLVPRVAEWLAARL